MKKKNPLLKALVVFLDIALILAIVNFFPTVFLKQPGMKQMKGTYVTVYYQKEKDGALELYNLAEGKAAYLQQMAGIDEEKHVNIYVYDKQSTMRMKKYGVLGALIQMDGYIGECKGNNIIMVSPANPGKVCTKEEVTNHVVYELLDCYLSQVNEKLSLWMKEGTILYLMDGTSYLEEDLDELKEAEIPKLDEINSNDEEQFKKIHGYAFAPLYLEYLDDDYGWDAVIHFLENEDYEEAFSKTQQEVYQGFTSYMESYYQ